MSNDRVEVKVTKQGVAVCGESGYMLKSGNDVVAFYLDGWGKTGKIYQVCSSSSVWFEGKVFNYPSLSIDDGSEGPCGNLTEICFPEFAGWQVHCVSGGKTMAICLTKDKNND